MVKSEVNMGEDIGYSQNFFFTSRKRPQPYTHEFFSGQCGDKEEMEECNAALILMKLSHSPKNAEKLFGSSPGSSSSSGSSWSSGSSSPPLSDDGHAGLNTSPMLNDPSARIRTTSVSTSDEGIVVDFNEEAPRKKRVSTTFYTPLYVYSLYV
ncbi:unnamed protein product [Ceratitis capitata]|uniref:(Mediterranean fruit fly) hypothetical protein n=1 Tax=Ceratitis capitata TaxID=7213 RepID=A0A811U9Q9_CERCA|nr:unnamed protein product [Ceratitis capitata]